MLHTYTKELKVHVTEKILFVSVLMFLEFILHNSESRAGSVP